MTQPADIIASFSYESLPGDHARKARLINERIRKRIGNQVRDIINNGRDLLEMKELLEHGQFQSYLADEFPLSLRAAQLYMGAAQWAEGKSEIVSHLSPTMMYQLAAKSTPETVEARVVERIEKMGKVEPAYLKMIMWEANIEKREAEEKRLKAEKRAYEKRNRARWDRERKKRLEAFQRDEDKAKAAADNIAKILVAKLSTEELDQVYKALATHMCGPDQCRLAISTWRSARPEPAAEPLPENVVALAKP